MIIDSSLLSTNTRPLVRRLITDGEDEAGDVAIKKKMALFSAVVTDYNEHVHISSSFEIGINVNQLFRSLFNPT